MKTTHISARELLKTLEGLNFTILNPYGGDRFSENDRRQVAGQMQAIRKIIQQSIDRANRILVNKGN